jgi:DNA-binding transcriptional MerR regulator
MPLRIGQLASQSGASTDTIRYYERMGLLGRPPRSDAGYRLYPDQALNRLRVIRNARRFGFSLAEIRGFLAVRDRGGAPCAEVRRAAERRLAEVESQIAELARTQQAMRDTLARWNDVLAATPAGHPAGLLEYESLLPEPRAPLGRR